MDVRRIAITCAVLLAVSALASPLEQLLVRLTIGTQKARPVSMVAPLQPSVAANTSFFADQSRFTILPASVVGEPPDHLLQRLLLGRGSKDGVAVGDAVSSEEGIYLGRIVAVSDTLSTMAYVSSELDKVTVRIATKDRPLGILQGLGVSGARIDYLDKNADIPQGAAIVSSEREFSVAPGLFIGAVDTARVNPTGVFQEASVRLPIGLSGIEHVLIIHTKNEQLP